MISVAARTAYPRICPAPRVRIEGFIEPLRERGIELDYLPGLTDEEYRMIAAPGSSLSKAALIARAAVRERRTRPDADLTLVHRLLFLTPFPGLDPPRSLDIYDFDDALYCGSIGAANRAAAPLKREVQRWRRYVRSARLVIAGNERLAEVASRERGGAGVEVVPSCVDPTRFRPRSHRESEVLTLGWIGSPSTAAYLEPVLATLGAIRDAGVSLRLVVIGADLAHDMPWLECRPWSLEREADEIASFDIGLMPMPDDEWSRGKCGYKVLQYFAAGVPAIASSVGVAPKMIGAERGYAVKTEEGWQAAIRALAADAGARAQMGANARTFVERNYSYSRWAPELAAMIGGLA